MSGRDWRYRAVCRDLDPDLFFPTAESGPAFDAQTAKAKAFCRVCTARAECLAFALERVPDGIAGGLTAAQRRRLRTNRRAVSA